MSGGRRLARLLGLAALAHGLACGNGHVDGGTAGAAGAGGAVSSVGGSAAGQAGAPEGAGVAGQTATGASGAAGARTGDAGATGAGASSVTGAVGAASTDAGGDASTDAGGYASTDAGGYASSTDGGAATSCAGRLVCEGFEQLAVGGKLGAPVTEHASKGTVAVDDTRAYSGTHSLKVSITATTAADTYREAYLSVTGAPLIPLPQNHVYGRFMIYTDRIPDKTVHWTIAHGDGPVGALSGTYNYGGMGGLMANYYRNTTPDPNDCWQTKNSAFPTGRWTCVGFEFDGGANTMHFSLDGADVPELDVAGLAKTDATCTVKGVDGRWLAPTFAEISVGWESYQNDVAGAHDAWLDDVVLDVQPIGCP